MFAFMNREALTKTLELGEAVYWSRSRSEIWHKGATSGHVQKVIDLRVDCDQDVVLLRVLSGPACHVGYNSCFYRAARIENGKAVLEVIKDGKVYDPEARLWEEALGQWRRSKSSCRRSKPLTR